MDVKQPKKKEKINISINSYHCNNNNISNNCKLEKLNSSSNHIQKNNCKILSSRPTSLLNKKRHTAINTNDSNILKKSINRKNEYYTNKLTFSNPNLM